MVKKLFGSLLLAFVIALGLGVVIVHRSTYPDSSVAMPWAIVSTLPITLLFFAISLIWPRVKHKKRVFKIIGVIIAVLISSYLGLWIWLRTHHNLIDDPMGDPCYALNTSLASPLCAVQEDSPK